MGKRLGILGAAVLISLLAFLGWWKISLAPVDPSDIHPQSFVIAKGSGVRDIAKQLRDQNLIHDQVAFFLLVKFRLGIDRNIQAGTYQLTPSMSAYEIAQRLTVGTEDTWITVPEGWRTSEIVTYLQKQGFTGNPGPYPDGRYFPDTYSVPKSSSIEGVLKLMADNFTKKVPQITNEQLIIASLVEREAKTEADRPLVASVLYNRLEAGMALDVDATIQYALGSWKKDLTLDDLKVKSPHNTYQNPGLPPGPICNPGLSAINAAKNPAQTNYLFYLSDKSGVMHYAKTLEEHNANVAKFLP